MGKSRFVPKLFRVLMAGIMVVSMFAATGTVASATGGATINVPADQTTIQAAIDAATAGDTIVVAAGTYTENIIVYKSLTIEGTTDTQGVPTTIVQAAMTDEAVFTFNADAITMRWLKIYNPAQAANGIDTSGTDNHNIELNLIENCVIGVCMGYWSDGSDNNLIQYNVFKSNISAVEIFEMGANNIIYTNEFDMNASDVYLGPYNTGGNNIWGNNFVQGGKCWEDTDPTVDGWVGQNMWYHSGLNEGNGWGDYAGVDIAPADGIGDTPYDIYTTDTTPAVANQDMFPLIIAQTPDLPDLIVYDKWEEWIDEGAGTYRINYVVMNVGSADCPSGHDIGIKIDGGDPFQEIEVTTILAPGENVTGQSNIVTLSDTSDIISVGADVNAEVDELSELNNQMDNTWPPQEGKPDLTVLNLHGEWSDEPSDLYDIVFDVKNIGTTDTTAESFQFQVTVDGTPHFLAPGVPFPASLAPGETVGISISDVTISDGSDALQACVDTDFEIDELDETNNCAATTFDGQAPEQGPDLIVINKYEEWVDEPNGEYLIYFTVKNIGTADSPGGHDAMIYINEAPHQLITIDEILAPNGTYSTNTTSAFLDVGATDNITICADANRDVTELDENNNCIWNLWPAPQEGKPDLVITQKYEEWVNEKAGTYEIFFTVANMGTATATAGHEVGIKIDSVELQQITVPVTLAPGEWWDGKSILATLEGETDNISVKADVNLEVNESNEDNNGIWNIWPVPTINVPDDFTTIQAAVNAAEPGDHIIVQGGQYVESVTVDKSLVLKGDGMPIVGTGTGTEPSFLLDADNIVIKGFMTINSGNGIDAPGTDGHVIEENYFMDGACGLFLGRPWDPSDENIIQFNVFDTNNDAIIMMDGGFGNLISQNMFDSNQYSDIMIGANASGANIIHHNNFAQGGLCTDNTDGTNPDYAGPNVWFDAISQEGNFWGDYAGVDDDQDGIGDTPYSIDGAAASMDNFPIMTVLPDLEVVDVHMEPFGEDETQYVVHFTIVNSGSESAPASHQVNINIDGTDVQQITVPEALMPGQWYTDNTTVITLDGETDNVTVCADIYDIVEEEHEDNNCMWNVWPPAGPPTIFVPGDYTTIQAAVDAANPGDAIYVNAGTYNENVYIDKSLLLQAERQAGPGPGEDAPAVFVTGADAQTPVFTIEADYLQLEGFDVTGAEIGISINNSSNIMIQGNNLHNIYNALYCINATSIGIAGNVFSVNEYGITLEYADDYHIVNNAFDANNTLDILALVDSVTSSGDVHHNKFIQGGKCIDDSWATSWYDAETNEGNFWGDYEGTDANEDGIGDTIYPIFGSGGFQVTADPYPLMGGFAPEPGPDLEIIDLYAEWVDEEAKTYTVNMTVANWGPEPAPANHVLNIHIDDADVQQITVPVILNNGEEYTATSNVFTVSGETDNITVCADYTDIVAEMSEDNNCCWNVFPFIPPVILVPDDYATIQAAVDAAEQWSIIKVAAGTYIENVNVYKEVRIEGHWEEGQEAPVAIVTAAEAGDPVFNITANNTGIETLEIRGGSEGVYINGTGATSVVNNNIHDNSIGILVDATFNNGMETWIGHNAIVENSDGIVIENGDPVMVEGNKFDNNMNRDIYLSQTSVFHVYQMAYNHFLQGGKCVDDATTTNPQDGVIHWYDHLNSEGNFWADYQGVDANQDGIGDTPYPIYNSSSAQVSEDLYPIMGGIDKPDLEIIDEYVEWVDEGAGTYTVNLTVKNYGPVAAPANHVVNINIDDVDEQQIVVPVVLNTGEMYTVISNVFTLSGDTDNITICADSTGIVDEIHEDNNCRVLIFPMIGIPVYIEAPDVVETGGDFVANVAIDYVENLNSVQYDIYFDPTVLQLNGFVDGDIDGAVFPGPTGEVAPQELEAGHWRVVQFLDDIANPAVNGTGYLSQIQFHVLGPVDTFSYINLEEVMLSGMEGEIPANWHGHRVDVVEALADPGDADGNGVVNIYDITSVARIILEYPDPVLPGADANGDGSINVLDISKIVRIILGID